MLLLFLIVSFIDVLSIGLIGPFVGLLAYSGNISEDYQILQGLLGIVDNSVTITFVGVVLASTFCVKGVIAFFVQKKILTLGYEIRTSIVEKLIKSYQNTEYEDIIGMDTSNIVVNTNTEITTYTPIVTN